MFWLRSFPRCQGDFYQDQDALDYYLRCLQCGREIKLIKRLESAEELTPELLVRVQLPEDSLGAKVKKRGRPGKHRKSVRVI